MIFEDKGSVMYNTTIKSYYTTESRLSLQSLYGSALIDASDMQ